MSVLLVQNHCRQHYILPFLNGNAKIHYSPIELQCDVCITRNGRQNVYFSPRAARVNPHPNALVCFASARHYIIFLMKRKLVSPTKFQKKIKYTTFAATPDIGQDAITPPAIM